LVNNRDHVIDLMRALGLILIVLAHTITFGTFGFQLRNFDVPMMVVVSGMAFAVTAPEQLNLLPYYWKRVLRLVLPTWVFLTLFFSFTALGFHLAGQEFPFPVAAVCDYFLLGHGANSMYVWIIRIFLLVALTAPGLLWVWRKVRPIVFIAILAAVYLGFECAHAYLPEPGQAWAQVLVFQYLYYALPYSVMFGVGMLLSSMTGKERLGTAVAMAALLIPSIILGHEPGDAWFQPQTFKYPPTLYFVSWGLGMSALLSALFMKVRLSGMLQQGVLLIGNASLWIYLWHMAVLFVIEWNPVFFGKLAEPGFLKFLFVLVSAVLLTAAHRYVFARVVERFPRTRGFISNAFLK
jgi:fucose 4-O-acetylase-like acetyltransferase